MTTTERPPVRRCASCNAPIWWRVNPSGRKQPMDFDLAADQPTDTPHHATCKDAKDWRRK